jgi:hypothetical protein
MYHSVPLLISKVPLFRGSHLHLYTLDKNRAKLENVARHHFVDFHQVLVVLSQLGILVFGRDPTSSFVPPFLTSSSLRKFEVSRPSFCHCQWTWRISIPVVRNFRPISSRTSGQCGTFVAYLNFRSSYQVSPLLFMFHFFALLSSIKLLQDKQTMTIPWNSRSSFDTLTGNKYVIFDNPQCCNVPNI